MAYVITDNCICCKYTDCVEICPVDCFREGPNMLVIDPNECIDCGLCPESCPVDAIYAESDLPEDKKNWLLLNDEMSKKWPNISSKKEALPDADFWKDIPDKEKYLER